MTRKVIVIVRNATLGSTFVPVRDPAYSCALREILVTINDARAMAGVTRVATTPYSYAHVDS